MNCATCEDCIAPGQNFFFFSSKTVNKPFFCSIECQAVYQAIVFQQWERKITHATMPSKFPDGLPSTEPRFQWVRDAFRTIREAENNA